MSDVKIADVDVELAKSAVDEFITTLGWMVVVFAISTAISIVVPGLYIGFTR